MRFSVICSVYFAVLASLTVSVTANSIDNSFLNNNLTYHHLSIRAISHDEVTQVQSTLPIEKKKENFGPYSRPKFLTGGTVFYIVAGTTLLLWTTGKIIDVKIERQERYAEALANGF